MDQLDVAAVYASLWLKDKAIRHPMHTVGFRLVFETALKRMTRLIRKETMASRETISAL